MVNVWLKATGTSSPTGQVERSARDRAGRRRSAGRGPPRPAFGPKLWTVALDRASSRRRVTTGESSRRSVDRAVLAAGLAQVDDDRARLAWLELGHGPLQALVARLAGRRQLAAWRSVRKTTSFWGIVEASSTRSIASKLATRSVPPWGRVISSISLSTSAWFGEGSPIDDPGRVGHQDDADRVAPARVLDELRGERLGLLEPGHVGRRVGHAQRAVEHEHPVRPPARPAPAARRGSRGTAWPSPATTQDDDQRPDASRSHCSIRIRRWFFRIAASRNRIAAQRISRNLRRLSRWMMIGTDAAARPAEQGRAARSPRRPRATGSSKVIGHLRGHSAAVIGRRSIVHGTHRSAGA